MVERDRGKRKSELNLPSPFDLESSTYHAMAQQFLPFMATTAPPLYSIISLISKKSIIRLTRRTGSDRCAPR